MDNAPVGVFSAETSGELVAMNPRLRRLMGFDPQADVPALNVLTDPAIEASGVTAVLRRCLETGLASTTEHTQPRPHAPPVQMRLTAEPLRDASGRVTGVLGIVEDVGERRALERRLWQHQKLESVGQLAAGIAHEINNPMAYVRANLTLLRGEWDALREVLEKAELAGDAVDRLAGWEELIDDSLEGVERTVAIVRDMKEFSHAGGEERVPADLNQLVEGSVRMATAHREPTTHIEASYAALPAVVCAPGPLRQVFVNLLVNALQSGARRVGVATSCEAEQVVVRVEDDGCGVRPEHQDRLFDPFFTTKPAGEGTGLGLYVSYEIVRLHGGEIRVESAPGRGSTFEVRLPLSGAASS